MVSRYGVSKEGAVGVAVGVGPMHCLLPHCGGPHHHHHLSAPHPQNPQPGHNHHVHPAHQPPPSPSPHLNHQLSHHQLTVNINHLSHQQQQQQQTQHQQAPPQYRVVTANARSDFHVSGQNYGTQPGGQVGGGGGSVGVPGGRGPPPLGGLQSIGQSAAGIPPGGPAGGQVPSQTPAPGVQSQQPQGPAPTTTPPVHTPSPQEMGKQAHLQPQSQPLSQVYGPTQTRPTSQGYYPQGARPQQPRGISHRGGQGGSGAQVVGMSGVGGGGGQPTTLYHPGGLPVQTGAMFQVPPNIHPGPHQQSVYPMNSQIPLQGLFGGPPQRHQTHQNQSYFAPFQNSAILTQHMFGYGTPTATPVHQSYFWPGQPANPQLSLSRAGASAVTGGAQHVTGPLAGTQGAPVVQQGTLQQSTQQAQPLPAMGISLSQTDVYSGHNGGATNTANSTIKSRKPRGQNAITDIVDPSTGKNISHEIYKDNETIPSGESSNRETPQPQNNDAEVQAEFAARVAKTLTKVATDESSSDSTVPTSSVSNTAMPQNIAQSLPSSQTSSSNDANSQCSTSSPTQNIPTVTAALCSHSSLGTASNVAQVDSSAVKRESKPLQIPVKEFQPRGEMKSVVIEEPPPPPPPAAPRNLNKDDISPQLTAITVTEEEVKSTTSAPPPTVTTPVSIPQTNAPSTNVPEVPKPSATAPCANPLPAREPFPNLSAKNSSSSPPRRKSQVHSHNQPAVATELHSSAKEQKEKKTREKSVSSRGATPTPAHNQTDHHPKANGDATVDKLEPEPPRSEAQQQKSSDGKAMQKQKSNKKLKPRELNRKGAEKEGTDMDAFVNTVPPTKTDTKQESKESLTAKDSNKEASREITKDAKEKDNYESKKEKELASVPAKTEKHVTPPSTEILKESSVPVQSPVIEKLPSNEETVKEPSPKLEDSNESSVCNMQVNPVPNDVVDHAKMKEESDVEAIVAQKNEENSKVSAIRTASEEKLAGPPVIEKPIESEPPAQTETPVTNQITLKYKYKDGQWSPLNKSGKKVYDRDFLITLQSDPNSKIRPANLPDLDVVLKDGAKSRSAGDIRPFNSNPIRHDALFPGFIKPQLNTRMLATNRKSHSGKSSKPQKTNVIHMSLSLKEDVKLRETENAWKPTRLKAPVFTEDEAKTEALYKRVRSVLNKLTPQKFNTLVDQVRALNIDTPERLQGVINLVFEKAVDEPNFSVAYALMCKELSMMEVSGSTDKNVENQECSLSFKKLIITRCQKEYEKHSLNEEARNTKFKQIEECPDPEKKKELMTAFEEEERRIRIKSVGNIRFIGELYKQRMLTTKIMRACIEQLLDLSDEDSLECLCKLLTTIGKDLESKGRPDVMQDYFNKMQDIVSLRGNGKISSRIRFMLQDVIDLRANKWVPRRVDSTPKTIDQIQKEAEDERLDSQLSNTPLNTPRKDERPSDRKRSRGVGQTDDAGWIHPVARTRQAYTVETAKLKNKPPPIDDMQLGTRNMYMWKTPSNCGLKAINSNKFACLQNMPTLDQDKRMMSPQLSGSRSTGPREYGRDYKSSYDGRSSRNGSHQLSSSSSSRDSSLLDSSQSQSVSLPPSVKSSQSTSSSHKPPLSEEEFMKAFNDLMTVYLKNPVTETVGLAIQQKFDNALSKFVRELINFVLEKSPVDRERVSYLISYLVSQKILPLQHLRNGFIEILELVDELMLDIPKVWLYLAEILSDPIKEELLPLQELRPLFDNLRSRGYVGKFLGEVLSKLCRDKGSKWVADKWDQSELQMSNILDTKLEEVDKIIKDYNLDFCTGDYNSAKGSSSNQPTLQQIHNELRRLMKESSFDEICDWIIVNVDNRVKEPEFIRVLTTAILETSMEPVNNKWYLKTELFINLQQLIRRFVDANESLELQCLYAIQFHLHKLQYPSGILFNIMTSLSDYNIISSDAFLTWKKSPEPAQREWHGVATMALTSFFTGLQEADDASSVEDLSTGVNQDRC